MKKTHARTISAGRNARNPSIVRLAKCCAVHLRGCSTAYAVSTVKQTRISGQ
jgi:hypothetical protein